MRRERAHVRAKKHMSVTHFVLVINHRRRTWVKTDADYDLDWDVQAQAHVADKECKFTFDRAKALCMAHDAQRKLETDGGVWEVFINSRRGETAKK